VTVAERPTRAAAHGYPDLREHLAALERAGLLVRVKRPMLAETEDLAHGGLRTIVATLKRRADAPAESLMTDVPTDDARSTLAALLVEEFLPVDVRVSIEQFQKRLERSQRLRRAREVSQSIAEVQAKTGAAAPATEELRTLHQESAAVYGITGGVAQTLETGRPGPQGAREA